ncbi:unnamed protein product [Ilex paraguariensis]|uniref:Expansin-like EG45 domain-containing protein n=1 Tax=Ilex paraguariensis TaxID=185542 RepID=A0ABC8USW3_9AQUA
MATKCNGNRQDQFPPGNLFVAVSEGLWDNGAACGRRFRLRCLSGHNRPCKGGTVDVRVVDFCPKRPCPSNILMSNDAFAALSHSQKAKINVEFIQYTIILLLLLLRISVIIVTSIFHAMSKLGFIIFTGFDMNHGIILLSSLARLSWQIGMFKN